MAAVIRFLDLEFSDIRIIFSSIRKVQHGADGVAPINGIGCPRAVGHAAHRRVVEQHNGGRIFARDLAKHCKKAADLPSGDCVTVEHCSYRIDDDEDRPVRANPTF